MTISSALKSPDAYRQFVAETLNRPSVERSTVVVWSNSRSTDVAEGEVFFVILTGDQSDKMFAGSVCTAQRSSTRVGNPPGG